MTSKTIMIQSYSGVKDDVLPIPPGLKVVHAVLSKSNL
jgi:hypothetical protein